jgi:Tfp pilus assembly PilM family ATPase
MAALAVRRSIMANIIYLSATNIEVVCGTRKRDAISVDFHRHIPLEEGALINGVIIDEAPIKQHLLTLKGEGINEAVLIIDSNKILAKSLSIPKMNHKQILAYVQDELSSLYDGDDKLIYDYAYLGDNSEVKGSSRIFAVGIEKSFLENYLHLFEDVGITLTAVDFSINALINLTDCLPGLMDESYAITSIDGNNLTSVVFTHGDYALTSRNRIFTTEEDPTSFVTQVTNVMSNLTQFASSAQNNASFKEVYFTGISKPTSKILFAAIANQLNLRARFLPDLRNVYASKPGRDELSLNTYLYTLGYLIGE